MLSLSKPATSHSDATLGHISSSWNSEDYKNERGSSFIAG